MLQGKFKTSDFSFEIVFPVLHNGEPIGTGFSVLPGSGLVVTAAHVVRGKDQDLLGIDSRRSGKVFGVDFKAEHHEADIAVLGVKDRELRNSGSFLLMPFEPLHDNRGVGIGDELETFGYFTHSSRAPTVGRLLKGSVQRLFTEEQGLYRYEAFECSFDNALHRLSGAPVMAEKDWHFGLLKGMVTKRESLDDDDDGPIENLWTTCLVFTDEIRRWIDDASRHWNA